MPDHYQDIDTSKWTPGTRYFTQITDTDHSAWLYIVTIMSFIFVILAFIIRFIVKYGMYGHDDWALLASTVLAISQYILILAGVARGVGQSTWVLGYGRVLELQKYAAAHAFLFILAHCLSKLSTAILTLRLFNNGRDRNTYLCWFLIASSTTYGIGATMALSIRCNNPYNSFVQAECPHVYPRWQVAMSLDITTETLLIIIPFILVYDVRIKRADKITVMAVFAARIVDVVFAALNLYCVHAMQGSLDPALDAVLNLSWTQAELLWSIVAASLPCVRTFLRPWMGSKPVSECPAATAIDRTILPPIDRTRAGESVEWWRRWMVSRRSQMVGRQSHHDQMVGRRNHHDQIPRLRPEAISHNVIISGGADSTWNMSKSWGSQEYIIRRQKEVEVTTSEGIGGIAGGGGIGGGRDPYEIP